MKIKDLLKEAGEVLGEGKELDAEVLLCEALGVERHHLIVNAELDVDTEYEKLFRAYLGRVADGEPVAYVLMHKEFHGLDFFVDKRVLVPRPETEQVVDLGIEFLREFAERGRLQVLDLGTGSGNIAVAIARVAFDLDLHVDACDVSDDACDVARLNVEQNGVDDRVDVFQSDLLENVEADMVYDLVVANLPYIGEVENHFVEKNVEDFEPNVALFGGRTGLELYERTFEEMIEKGIEFKVMIGEFGFAQGEAVKILLEKYYPGKWHIIKDLADIERLFVISNKI